MNLPDIYARVCAVRPELAVKWLGRSTNTWADDHPPITVWIYGPSPATSRAMLDDHAAALILARWVEGLPVGFVLYQRSTNVWECDWINDIWYEDNPPKYIGPTPIEALAAFYLGET